MGGACSFCPQRDDEMKRLLERREEIDNTCIACLVADKKKTIEFGSCSICKKSSEGNEVCVRCANEKGRCCLCGDKMN